MIRIDLSMRQFVIFFQRYAFSKHYNNLYICNRLVNLPSLCFLKKKKNKAVLVVLHRLKMYSTADSDATEKALQVRLVKSLARRRLARHLIRGVQQ